MQTSLWKANTELNSLLGRKKPALNVSHLSLLFSLAQDWEDYDYIWRENNAQIYLSHFLFCAKPALQIWADPWPIDRGSLGFEKIIPLNFVGGGGLFFLSVFFFFCHTHGLWKFLGQGLNLSHSCNLCHSFGNARSLTLCATVGTPPITYWCGNSSRKCIFKKRPELKTRRSLQACSFGQFLSPSSLRNPPWLVPRVSSSQASVCPGPF